jgi:hypothetical protein
MLDPCALLTSQQRGQLGLTDGAQQPDLNSHADSCRWTSQASTSQDYLARLVTSQPTGTGGEARPAPSTIGNHPTYEYLTSDTDPSRYCVYLIDLPPDHTLWVQYSDTSSPGHHQACQKNRAAATAMVATLTILTC